MIAGGQHIQEPHEDDPLINVDLNLVWCVVENVNRLYHDFGGEDLNGGALLPRVEEGEKEKAGIVARGKVRIVLQIYNMYMYMKFSKKVQCRCQKFNQIYLYCQQY